MQEIGSINPVETRASAVPRPSPDIKTGEGMSQQQIRIGQFVHQLRSGELDEEGFMRVASEAGLPVERARTLAREALATHHNQRHLRENLQELYDFIIIGAGTAGSVL